MERKKENPILRHAVGQYISVENRVVPYQAPIWRKFRVQATAILAFPRRYPVNDGVDNSHLHQFIIKDRTYSEPDFRLDEDFGARRFWMKEKPP